MISSPSGELPTGIWLEAKLREMNQAGHSYYIIQKGPSNGGAVLLKTYVPGHGTQVFTQIRDMDGQLTWMDVFEDNWVDERQADAYINEQISFDPDLWVVEIEYDRPQNPLCPDRN